MQLRHIRSSPGLPQRAGLHPARATFGNLVLRCLVSLLLTLLGAVCLACAPPGEALSDDEGSRLLGGADLEIYRDRSGRLGIEDVSSADFQAKFTPLKADGLALGYTRDVLWVRLCLHRAPTAPVEWWLESRAPYLDDIRFYAQRRAGLGWDELRAGDRFPVNARAIVYRTAVFPLELADGTAQVFYVRIKASTSMSTAFTVWQPWSFRTQVQRDLLGIGMALGLVLTVSAMNLVNWFWTGQRLYLAFAAFMFMMAVAVAAANGLLAQYFFPESDWVAHGLTRVLHCVFYGFSMLLVRKPLRLAEHFPVFDRILPYLAATIALCALSVPLGGYVHVMPVVQWLQPFIAVVGVMACYRNLRDGHLGAGWMLSAYLCFSGLMLVHVSRALGLLTWNSTFETAAPALITYAIFLHFGILSELRDERQAREAADGEAVAQRRLAEQEERLRHEQSLFFAFVAHELRSPLGVLLTGLGNLRRSLPEVVPENAERLARLNHAAQRMSGLIDRHLRLQRIGQPDFEPDFALEPVSLPALRALDEIRALHGGRDLRFNKRGALEQDVSMDAELVVLALSNLLDNAAKYSPEGTPIRLEVEASAGMVIYRVINAGEGLPPDLAERPFQVFRRSRKSVSTKGGFGIGLALASHVARVHGGALVGGHRDGETWFTLRLPSGGEGLPGAAGTEVPA